MDIKLANSDLDVRNFQRLKFLNTILAYTPLFGIAFFFGMVGFYFWRSEWQYLGVGGIVLIWVVFWVIARALFRQDFIGLSVQVLIFSTLSLFPAIALFWSGSSVSILLMAASWIFPLGIAFNGTSFQRLHQKYLYILGAIVANIAIYLIDRGEPLPRLSITDLSVVRWLLPFFIILVGSLLLIIITRTAIAKRLSTRILVAFLLVVLIPILSISTITTIESLETDQQYIFQTLRNISSEKSNEIAFWSSKLQVDLYSLPHNDTIDQNINALLYAVDAGQPTIVERNSLTEHFNAYITQTGRLQEIILMDPAGIVVASTAPEKLYKQYGTREFFRQGENGLWISKPTYSEDAGKLIITLSRPILNERGNVIGVLAGSTDIQAISKVVLSREGLGTSGQIKLVSDEQLLLNGVVTGLPSKTISSAIVTDALSTKGAGTMQYTNEDGTPVIGSYEWIPQLELIVITEMTRAEAFANAQSVLITNLFIALLGISISVVGALITARAVSAPVGLLAETANKVASGNLTTRVPVEGHDEIGTLGIALNNMTSQIQGLVLELEQRVAERTKDLERRTVEMRTAAQVARDASTASNIEDLLNRSTSLIRDRFGFYHTGIFLIDEHNEFAVLSAAGGDAGQLMLANRHKLRVGEIGIVGHVAKTGQPRIALDTGEDAVYFRNPLLPYTHSEMALPLKIGEKIIGVLDVQSERSNAFDQEDTETLQVMADQIAVAIERTKLLQQYEQVLSSLETAAQQYTENTWRDFSRRYQDNLGYRYQGVKIEPVGLPPDEAGEVIQKKGSIITPNKSTGQTTVAIPILLRGQAIGVIKLNLQTRDIPEQTMDIAEQTANRLALALENARLVLDAQRLAAREKQVNIITSRIQSSSEMELILQNAIQELGTTLGIPKTFIQIGLTDLPNKIQLED